MWNTAPPFYMLPRKKKNSLKKLLRLMEALEEREEKKKKGKDDDKKKDDKKPQGFSSGQVLVLLTIGQAIIAPIQLMLFASAVSYMAQTFVAIQKAIP